MRHRNKTTMDTETAKQTLSAALRTWRSGLGWTQEQAANALDAQIDTYRRWEQARQTPQGDHWERVWRRIQSNNTQKARNERKAKARSDH